MKLSVSSVLNIMYKVQLSNDTPWLRMHISVIGRSFLWCHAGNSMTWNIVLIGILYNDRKQQRWTPITVELRNKMLWQNESVKYWVQEYIPGNKKHSLSGPTGHHLNKHNTHCHYRLQFMTTSYQLRSISNEVTNLLTINRIVSIEQ